MSVREILHRSIRLASYGYDSVKYRYGWRSQHCVNLQSEGRCLFASHNAEQLKKSDTHPHHLSHHRSLWLSNTVQLFDADAQFQLGHPVQWLRDPKTQITTPLRFGRSIDYRDDQCVGEIKYLWELGRHQFLVPMAIRIAVNKDEAVQARLESHLSSWLEQNPIGMGIHWCSSLEIALRLISWGFIHSILQAGGMRNGIFDLRCNSEQLGVHIFAQVKFITGNYSRYSSSNNHLVGELTGVWMACNVFDLDIQGRRWRDSAFVELHREIQLQTHDDGVNKEQAIYYHLWTLEYFWLAWSIAKRFEHSVSVDFEEHLVAMVIFLEAMCGSTEYPSQIGDADGGVVCRFGPDISENVYQSLLAPISRILDGESTQSRHNQDAHTKAFWYQDIVAQSDVSSIADLYRARLAESDSRTVFESGGYYILQGENCRLMYKAGPFGYLSTGAHGHADALSITLAIDEQWWLVDPGTYTYHSASEWRNFFRSTAAHNTLCVNQSNQSDIAGDFLWSRRTDAHVECVEWDNLASRKYVSSVSGSHPGYADQGVKHQRTVKCDGMRTFEVHDLVALADGFGDCDLQLAFHFHPDINLKQLDTYHWLATRQNSELALSIELPENFNWSMKNGNESPIAGWYSETYGVKTPSNSLLGRRVVLNDTGSRQNELYRTVLVVRDSDGAAMNNGVSG